MVLSYALITPRITIPISIVTSIMVFGLTLYYDPFRTYSNERQNKNSMIEQNNQNDIQAINLTAEKWQPSILLFIAIYSALLIISYFSYEQEFHVFTPWNEIDIRSIIQLCAAIMLCFFIPGYALVDILSKKYTINRILALLLSYLLSVLITGITGYISSLSFDIALGESRYLFIGINLAVLGLYFFYQVRSKSLIPINHQIMNHSYRDFLPNRVFNHIRLRAPELLVFGSIITIIIISTYVLYDGKTFGDQWYHQGRALLFLSGSINEVVLSGADAYYPPFHTALMASLTVLSGIPVVNSYASIAFLNTTSIFAFYYFFTAWIPARIRRAALIAATLFTLSSGFGWIYFLSLTTTHPIISAKSSLEILTTLNGIDIVDPTNFAIPQSPDFSSPLILIALPAGFVLWALIRTCIDAKFNILIVTAISVLGILSHYEFFFFIIIASLLPIIFRMKAKNSLYCALLIAPLTVFLIDVTTPGNFYTYLGFFGIPLLFITTSFVTIMWTIYLTSSYLSKFFSIKTRYIAKFRQRLCRHRRFKFSTITAVILISIYLYLLSFVVLGQQSTNTLMNQTSFGTVPWFTYPMNMGIVGLLGLTFIFSYIFKKFEKQLFVFGIIIIVALIAGPYYNESRFSKYIMIGFIGLASVMIYEILNRQSANHPIRNGAIIGTIILTSGLSVLFFNGYVALMLDTHNYIDTLTRRHFPSMSELNLFETLNGLINIDSNKYNIISFPDQYNRWKDGFMVKVPSFVGIPYEKTNQSPLILNASTPDALYHLLDFSDAKYIIIPKVSIQRSSVLTEPTRFVLNYFKPIYEDNMYLILEIPKLVPPSSSSNATVALIYDQSDDLSTKILTDSKVLQFDNNSFYLNRNQNWITTQRDNETQLLSLLGAKTDKGIPIWSKNITTDKNVNYIEARLRIVSEAQNKSDGVRVGWQEGAEQEFYVKLSNDSLELYEKLKGTQYKEILLKNTEVEKNNWVWYTLRIENRDDSTNIYLNDVLKIQAPRLDKKIEPISKVGLYTKYNNVEYEPLRIGTLSEYSQKISEGTKFYDYYYPLSLLSLSNSSYDVFRDSDPSVFSKPVILVPSSLIDNNTTLTEYLDYVRKGGTLIVTQSQNNSSKLLKQLFSLTSSVGKEEHFTNIVADKNQNASINVSGRVNTINYTDSSDIDVVASYRNNKNKAIAPFVIEKNFPSGGKIILLNSEGYFDSLSKSPIKYFSTLSNISQLISVKMGKGVISQNTSEPSKGFIGKMEINGKASIYSSSLSLPSEANNPYLVESSHVAIFNGTDYPTVIKNISIKDLKIVGSYIASVNVSGPLRIPSSESAGAYIGVDLPNAFNMTVTASPPGFSSIKIVTQSQNSIKSYIFNNYTKVVFYNVTHQSPVKSVPLILKRPDIEVDGHVVFKNAALRGFLNDIGGVNRGDPLELQGQIKTGLELVDKFNQPYSNAARTTSVTYLKTLTVNGSSNEDKDQLNLPGDIYFKAKETGHDIDLKKVLTSSGNIIALIILIPIAVIIIKFINKKNM